MGVGNPRTPPADTTHCQQSTHQNLILKLPPVLHAHLHVGQTGCLFSQLAMQVPQNRWPQGTKLWHATIRSRQICKSLSDCLILSVMSGHHRNGRDNYAGSPSERTSSGPLGNIMKDTSSFKGRSVHCETSAIGMTHTEHVTQVSGNHQILQFLLTTHSNCSSMSAFDGVAAAAAGSPSPSSAPLHTPGFNLGTFTCKNDMRYLSRAGKLMVYAHPRVPRTRL